MRYAAVICPTERLGPDAKSFLAELKPRRERTGWSVAECPPQRGSLSTELATVTVGSVANGPEMELLTKTSKLVHYFDMEGSRLWLPRSLFQGQLQGQLPGEINLLHPSGDRLRTYKLEQAAPNVRTPPELLSPLSRGALYKAASVPVHSAFQVKVQDQKPRCGQTRTCSETPSALRAMLNPWVLTFDTRQELKPKKDYMLLKAIMKEAEVDFHLDFPPTDWLRVRLHTHLRSLWTQSPWARGGKPPLPRLMFGGKGEEWERARAFLVLDSTEGVFDVTGGVGPCAGPVKFGWKLSDKLSGTLQHWPVTEALRVLGIHPPGKDGNSASPAPTEEAEEGGNSSCSAPTELDPGNPDSFFGPIFAKLPSGSVPRELTKLIRDLPALSDEEGEAVNSIADSADGNSAAFSARFVHEYLMPRSRIRVAWPPPPEWMKERKHTLWNRWKKAEPFDPTLGWHDEISERRLTAWWLRFILPDEEEVPSVWKTGDYLWKGRFFAALFRTGEAPQWADPPLGGRLRSDRLGHFVLGGGSECENDIEGPWEYGKWPSELHLPLRKPR